MIPLELELENFLAYRDPGTLHLDGIHVACLVGPNGAGKSSLLDAITWCLWGKARTNSADELVHEGQTDMAVTLTFSQNRQRYRVLRQRSTRKRGRSLLDLQVRNPADSSWRSLAEGTIRETQARIDELLRLDYATFVNSAFLVQGKADQFTTKTPGERKEVLANILGLSRWEAYEHRAKSKIRGIEKSIQRLDGRLEELEKELGERAGYERELAAAEEESKGIGEQLANAEEEWVSLEQSRKDLISHQREIDDLTRRTVSREKEIAEAKEELAKALGDADEDALQAALSEVHGELAEFESLEAARDELQSTRTALAEEAANLQGINQRLGPETEPLKTRASILEGATEPVCPTCAQPLTEEHRSEVLHSLGEAIESRREQYRRNRDRIREIEAAIEEKDRELGELREQLEGRSRLEKRAGELEAALSHAAEARERADGLQKKIEKWQASLKESVSQREKIEKDAAETEQQLQAASLTQEDLDRLRRRKRMADERVGGARQQLGALEDLEKLHDEAQRTREREARDLSLYQELREAFSKRGVPAMIIETVVPELERSANDLLSRMTDGRLHVRIKTQREIKSGELREALDIVISDELGRRPYELYSGGEAFRINFAIRIALSKLLANRAGAQLRSLFIDEGFGTQDAQGREELIEAIRRVQEDFDRILVITHIEEMKDAFPTRIEVRKTPMGSTFSLN